MAIKKSTPEKTLNKKSTIKTEKPNVDEASKEEKLIDLELKKISLLEKKRDFERAEQDKVRNHEFEDRRIKVTEDSNLNSKILYLNRMLESFTIDTEKTIIGSEPALKQTFSEEEQYVIKAKLFELIKKL